MVTGVQKAWSITASSNANADSAINWAEGMTPAAVNNSARAEMAAIKAFANQILGANTSGGSANAQTFTSDAPGAISTAYAAGMGFVFKAGYSNSGACTFNADGVGAKSIKKGGAQAALAANDIVAGGIYFVVYEASGDCFLLLNPESGQIAAQPLDADLTAIAALGYTSGSYLPKKTAADTWSLVDEASYAHLAGTETFSARKTFAGGWSLTGGAQGIIVGSSGDQIRHYSDATNLVWNRHDSGGAYQSTPMFLVLASDVLKLSQVPQVANADVRVAGKTAVPIPASAMVPNTTNGAAAGLTETTTNKVMLRTLDFDTTTQESVQFLIPMPKGWNEGTVTFQPIWTAASGSGGVVWDCAGVALSDDDASDTAFGTAQTSTDTLLAAGDVHIGPESSAITIAGSPAENDLVVFRVRRVPADASDTLGVDAKLISIRLFITTNAKNDA